MITWQIQPFKEVWSLLREIIKAPLSMNVERLFLGEVIAIIARQFCSRQQIRSLLGQN